MNIENTDLVSLYEKLLNNEDSTEQLSETGIVLQVSDNVCTVRGLNNAIYNELINFENGNQGIIFDLNSGLVSIFLLYDVYDKPVHENEVAKRTRELFKIPVGDNLVGRVINSLGQPLDALGDIKTKEFLPTESVIPGIIDRSPIDSALETGTLAVDSLVPVGRGQRELIIGNRGTGKTSLAINTIINQKGKNINCIYVSIGQQQAKLARIINELEQTGALEYTTIVSASTSDLVMQRYLAPYAGMTIAEYFRSKNKDSLIVFDDLTNHAVAYREMSLLLTRPPGREAFPGDIFYLHSRLLERAGKVISGSSITAFPIVQIQNDDLSAYIPTNLISITDGQIFLDTKLFNQGIRPSVNIELSVSRVGGAAQTKAMSQMTKSLRLELAQYNELQDFAQFGTELDEISQKRLSRGAIAIELLKQSQNVHYSAVSEVLILFIFQANFLDNIKLDQVKDFSTGFVSYAESLHPEVYSEILKTNIVTDETFKKLYEIAKEFSKIFSPK